jgi:hypothetical protein
MRVRPLSICADRQLRFKVLAEFIIELADEHSSVPSFKKALAENGADFEESFVSSLLNLIQKLRPPKSKRAASDGGTTPLRKAEHNTLQRSATRWGTIRHVATRCKRCNAVQHVATRCNTLQRGATRCDAVHHRTVLLQQVRCRRRRRRRSESSRRSRWRTPASTAVLPRYVRLHTHTRTLTTQARAHKATAKCRNVRHVRHGRARTHARTHTHTHTLTHSLTHSHTHTSH